MRTRLRHRAGFNKWLALILLGVYSTVLPHPFPEPQLDRVNALLVKYPDNPELYLQRASVHITLEHFDQAFADLERAQTLGLHGEQLLLARGYAHLQRGSADLAIVDLSAALALDPGLPRALSLRAQAYQQNGQAGLALQDWQQLLEVSPKPSPSLFLSAAHAAGEDQNYPAQLAIIDLGLVAWPQDSSLAEAGIEVLWKQAEFEAALQRARQQAVSSTARPYYWEMLLADKLMLLGREAQASLALQRAAQWLDQQHRLNRGQMELRDEIRLRLQALDGGDS